jgi:type I site-specific restriction endonuclease
MENTRSITASKSPLELAKTALAAAREAIPQYTSRFSRHDFTQHQLYALVALRRLLKTDYRGLEATLRDWAELRDALGLVRVPDHSTIQRADRRFHSKSKSKSKPKAKTISRPASELAEAMPLFDRTGPAPAPVSGNAA